MEYPGCCVNTKQPVFSITNAGAGIIGWATTVDTAVNNKTAVMINRLFILLNNKFVYK